MTQERDIWGRRFNRPKDWVPMVTASTIHGERFTAHKARNVTLEEQVGAMIRHTRRIEQSIAKAKTPEQKAQREKLLLIHKARVRGALDYLDHKGRGFDTIREAKPAEPSIMPGRSFHKRKPSKALFDLCQKGK